MFSTFFVEYNFKCLFSKQLIKGTLVLFSTIDSRINTFYSLSFQLSINKLPLAWKKMKKITDTFTKIILKNLRNQSASHDLRMHNFRIWFIPIEQVDTGNHRQQSRCSRCIKFNSLKKFPVLLLAISIIVVASPWQTNLRKYIYSLWLSTGP